MSTFMALPPGLAHYGPAPFVLRLKLFFKVKAYTHVHIVL